MKVNAETQKILDRQLKLTISELMGVNTRTGDVGIEIETEGANLPATVQYHWLAKEDHSLRNRDGQAYEYVLRNPIPRAKVREVLTYLSKKFTEADAKPVYSYRTSVHVHLNAGRMTTVQVLTWLAVYFIIEDILTESCGEDRIGNRFCLRASDSGTIISDLVKSLRVVNFSALTNRQRRYMACNYTSLSNFGSVEFRAMKGTNNVDEISDWVDLLLKVQDTSKEFTDPRHVVEQFSKLGPRGFLKMVTTDKFYDRFSWKQGLSETLWEGARRVQDLAYAGFEWHPKAAAEPKTTIHYDEIAQAEAPRDPFERINDWPAAPDPAPRLDDLLRRQIDAVRARQIDAVRVRPVAPPRGRRINLAPARNADRFN